MQDFKTVDPVVIKNQKRSRIKLSNVANQNSATVKFLSIGDIELDETDAIIKVGSTSLKGFQGDVRFELQPQFFAPDDYINFEFQMRINNVIKERVSGGCLITGQGDNDRSSGLIRFEAEDLGPEDIIIFYAYREAGDGDTELVSDDSSERNSYIYVTSYQDLTVLVPAQ